MTTRIALHKILPALLTACLALGVSAGAAQAQFQLPAFDVTEDGANYGAIATTDSVGGTHFMWYRNSTGMQTRKRGVDGTLGPVQTIAGTATTNNALAADQAGNVQFVWII